MNTRYLVLSFLVSACAADGSLLADFHLHGGAAPDGGAMDGGGGAGGAVCVAPAPALMLPAAPRIMAVGDSITAGVGDWSDGFALQTGAYRLPLWAALPTVVPVGSQISPLPGALGKNANEGHSGYSSTQMATEFPGWLAAAGHVDAVLFHGGTNDGPDLMRSADAVESIYRALLASNPSALMFVANPIIRIQDAPADWVTAEVARAANLTARLATLPRAIAVPMPDLVRTEMYDSFHPNANGYRKMALAWEAALRSAGAL